MSNPQESIDAVLAKNLLVARMIRGVTQQELAQRADISRATIAQIETGYSDPRLSTVADLAAGLGVPLVVLLVGLEDVQAIATALKGSSAGATYEQLAVRLPDHEIQRMLRFQRSGMLKDRARAARIGAAIARLLDGGASAEVFSAIFSAILPGPGTLAGMLLGQVLADTESCTGSVP